jgi:TolB-like protein/Flp pilus assembly protein TadD
MGGEAGLETPPPAPSPVGAANGLWARVQEHKIIQWGVGYLGAALALAHGAELVTHALHWPDTTWRIFVLALIVGFPIALTLAWYHGDRGLKQVGAGELMMISVLALIGAVFFTVTLRPEDEHAAETVPAGLPREQAPPDSNGVEPSAAEVAPSTPMPNSIAVLPFDNFSPDPNNAYFAQGLHDELLGQLGKIKSLNVIARTSVMRYANAARDITDIARELRVEAVMESSVSYADERVAVRTKLIDAQTGVQLWSESYDRELRDIIGIQADIAMNIANALRAEFSIEEQQDIEREATDSPAAYALYLQARGLVGSSGAVARMHELYDQAIAIDSDFAAAYAWKAVLYSQELINTPEGAARPWTELEPRIREYAARALELDRAQPVAYAALSALSLFSWRWTDFREARDRSPTTTLVGPVTSWSRAWLDNPAEALEVAQRGVDLNPLDWIAHWAQGVSLTYAHDYAAASAKFRQGIALVPVVPQQRSMLGLAQAALGNTDEARRQLELAEQLSSAPMLLADVAYGYGRIGDAENARRVFEEIVAATDQGQDIGVGGWALAHLAVGDTDEALAWLERGADKARRHEPDPGFFALMNLRMNFTADLVLERPEFVDVRNRLRGD